MREIAGVKNSLKEACMERVESIGKMTAHYGLVLILAWIGTLKFFEYEANGIQLFVANHPLMSWVYAIWSVRTFSALLGIVEIGIAILIALRDWQPKLSLIGGALGSMMFLTTLSFILTTPGMWEPGYGFPALNLVSSFLLKDLVLLGVSLWVMGESGRVLLSKSS
jgi:reactive chlorine resistance protein C